MDDAEPRTRRIAITYAGDVAAPESWSGTPANLLRALRVMGIDVEPLNAGVSDRLEVAVASGLAVLQLHRIPLPTLRERLRVSRSIVRHSGPRMGSWRTRAIRRRIERSPPLDGAVQLGTEYGLPTGFPCVTFDDMTVAQAVTLPYPEWQLLTEAERAVRIDLQRHVYDQAVACCFATPWAANSAMSDYGAPRDKVRVVGIGPNHAPRPLARDWRLPRFLWVGSDWSRKNGDAVLRAFAEIRAAFPGARLDLAGDHPPVHDDGVVGHGSLSLGSRTDCAKLVALYETATCFVMPSTCEPAGISYVEAAGAAVPSIGSTVGGSAYLIGDGGCVVDPADHGALIAAMRELADADVARAAGARALARAEQFTWAIVAAHIIDVLALDGSRHPIFESSPAAARARQS